MVTRRTIILICSLLLSLALAGCEFLKDFFSMSPFPGYLSQAVASVDLSEEVDDFVGGETHWSSQVFVLRRLSDGNDFVFLIIQRDSGWQRVFALDDSLDLRSYGTVDHHNEIHLVEATGDFVVGDVRFSSATLSASQAGLPTDVWGYGFSDGASNYVLRDEGTQIKCYIYEATAWAYQAVESYYIEDLGSGYVNYRLVAVRYDPFLPDVELLGFPVYLVFYNWEEEYVRMVKTPVNDYPDSLEPTLVTPAATYPYSSKVYEISDRFFCCTRKGAVASSRQDGVFYRISFQGEELDRFRVSKEERPVMDFDLDGEYYYYFDKMNTRLYKAVTGW